jgi:hypothetical protein
MKNEIYWGFHISCIVKMIKESYQKVIIDLMKRNHKINLISIFQIVDTRATKRNSAHLLPEDM